MRVQSPPLAVCPRWSSGQRYDPVAVVTWVRIPPRDLALTGRTTMSEPNTDADDAKSREDETKEEDGGMGRVEQLEHMDITIDWTRD